MRKLLDRFSEKAQESLDAIFGASVAATEDMTASALVEFFDKHALPYPVQITFNPNEVDVCYTIGDVMRKYFSLGYRCGAVDCFQKECIVTEVPTAPGASKKFIFSGGNEHLSIHPLKSNNVLSESTDKNRPQC